MPEVLEGLKIAATVADTASKAAGTAKGMADAAYAGGGQSSPHGGMTGNAGVISPQLTPFVRITRKKGYYPGEIGKQIGHPSYELVRLGSLTGFTRVHAVHVEIAATAEENNQIERLLKGGIIL